MALAFIKFFPTDYIADTRTLSTHTKGCYMDLLCLLHDNGGQVSKSIEALARFFGCSKKAAEKALQELEEEEILEVTFNKDEKKYNLLQRRMLREEEEREYERTKKQKQRDRDRDTSEDDEEEEDGTNAGQPPGQVRDNGRDKAGTKPESRAQKPDHPPTPQRSETAEAEGLKKEDWEALCKRKKITGISIEKARQLEDEVLAHLLAVYREKLSGKGEDIRNPLAIAQKRAKDEKPTRDDLRTVSSWLHPPPLKNEVYNPQKPFIETHRCHCGGELRSEYASGAGETTYICNSCGRGYPKR